VCTVCATIHRKGAASGIVSRSTEWRYPFPAIRLCKISAVRQDVNLGVAPMMDGAGSFCKSVAWAGSCANSVHVSDRALSHGFVLNHAKNLYATEVLKHNLLEYFKKPSQ